MTSANRQSFEQPVLPHGALQNASTVHDSWPVDPRRQRLGAMRQTDGQRADVRMTGGLAPGGLGDCRAVAVPRRRTELLSPATVSLSSWVLGDDKFRIATAPARGKAMLGKPLPK
jgi:hypothetical protein